MKMILRLGVIAQGAELNGCSIRKVENHRFRYWWVTDSDKVTDSRGFLWKDRDAGIGRQRGWSLSRGQIFWLRSTSAMNSPGA